MEIDEHKILIIGKSIAIALMIILFALIFFLFLGICKVDAQIPDYNWNSPRLMGISTSDSINDESAILASSTNSNSVTYNSNIQGGKNAYVRYRVSNSDQATTYLAQGTYSFSYKVRFTLIGTNSIAKVTPKLYYYPNSASTYGNATCDTTPTMILTQTGIDPTTYDYTYSCNTFNVTTNVSWFAFGFSTSIPINSVSMIQNLKFVGPSDTQEVINNQNQNTQDIINNQNKNKQDIINNQNKNTQDIINNQNKNTQDIEGVLTDDTLPDLDSFNDMSGWLPPGPLDSVLNLPLNILNGLTNAFNGNTCTSIYIPLPYLKGDLELPCLYSIYSQINGLNIFLTTLFTTICGYLIYKYLCNLYVWIEDRIKLKEDNYMSDWGGV